MISSHDVSRETQRSGAETENKVSEGASVKIKIEDREDTTTTAVESEEPNTCDEELDSDTSSEVEIPSAIVKAEASSSDDSRSMPPPPAVVRAALPSTGSLNASVANASIVGSRIHPAAGASPMRTTSTTVTPITSAPSSPAKQEVKLVPVSHTVPTSSSIRLASGPSNQVVRTGLVGRPAVPSTTPAAIAAMKATKLQGNGKVIVTVYPNQVLSSSVIPKSSPPVPPTTISSPDGAQSAASQYPNSTTTCSDAIGSSSVSKKKAPHPLRRGKWTTEEEAYANRLIGEFKSGLLPLTDGTTLRNFLSKLLNCDPMRISKKFVGNNCIGKQVFRRRVAEINRLTADQMQQTKIDLIELERRFLDRVAQTNRVKAPGTIGPNGVMGPLPPNFHDDLELDALPTPPWLRPPAKYKPTGKFAERLEAKAKAAAERKAKLEAAAAAAAAAASDEASLDDVEEPEDLNTDSALDQLARTASSEVILRSQSALEQLAKTASAAKFVEDIVNGDGSDEAKAEGRKLSQSALQGSFNVLMSMDLQSVENLVELASSSNLASLLTESKSSAQMETFIQSLSSGNLRKADNDSHVALGGFLQSLSRGNLLKAGEDSHVALGNLLQSIHTDLHDENSSSNNLFDPEKFINRAESVTGFSKLRAKDGLSNACSVEDFLSLMASGDIPHQDPSLLNVPLQKVMQQHGVGAVNNLKRKLSQQQLNALASRISRSRIAGSATNVTEKGSVKKQKKV